MRDADTALSRAKTAGRGTYELFDPDMRAQLVRRIDLIAELETAVETDAFEVVYQPIVALADGAIVAFEQLVRWHSSGFGTVAPGEFIPLAEQTGLIVPLGRLLFERAAVQAAHWRSQLPGLLPHGIGVNVSARELEETDFAAFADSTLARHGLTSADIAIELTERVVIDDRHPAAAANLQALSGQGFNLILDDFGSGYSALSSLKRFPLRALKIDRFFTAAIRDPGDDAPVIRAIIGLGKALDLRLTAEGVETQTQLGFSAPPASITLRATSSPDRFRRRTRRRCFAAARSRSRSPTRPAPERLGRAGGRPGGRGAAVVPESVVPSGPPWRLELPSNQLQGG